MSTSSTVVFVGHENFESSKKVNTRTFRSCGFYWAGDGRSQRWFSRWVHWVCQNIRGTCWLSVSDWNGECRSGMESGMERRGCAMSSRRFDFTRFIIHFSTSRKSILGEIRKVFGLFVSNSSMRRSTLGFMQYAVILDFGCQCRLVQSGVDMSIRSSITWVRCRIPLT